MFPRHPRHLNRRSLFVALNINHAILKEIQIIDVREGFAVALGREVGFCVRGCDDGEGAAERGFDVGVEVVAELPISQVRLVDIGWLFGG